MHLYAAAIALANDDGNVLNLVTNQMNEQNKGEQQKNSSIDEQKPRHTID